MKPRQPIVFTTETVPIPVQMWRGCQRFSPGVEEARNPMAATSLQCKECKTPYPLDARLSRRGRATVPGRARRPPETRLGQVRHDVSTDPRSRSAESTRAHGVARRGFPGDGDRLLCGSHSRTHREGWRDWPDEAPATIRRCQRRNGAKSSQAPATALGRCDRALQERPPSRR